MNSIENILSGLKPTSEFCTKHESPTEALSIEVKGLGALKFPLPKYQLRKLVKIAELAPFGYREQTIVDTRVRNVWEIKKNQVKIDARQWNKTLSPILKSIQQELGFPPGKIKARLDKLLIYEKGQFFSPHKDSEKDDNMLGSLSVILPSEHNGGTLVVSHQDQSKKLQSRGKTKNLNFFAFYSDCKHEIKKVTDGYRVALSYQLFVETSHNAQAPSMVDKKILENLKQELSFYFKDSLSDKSKEESPNVDQKFVYLLNHEYTPKGMSANALKGIDNAKLHLFKKIAKELELNIYLALADIHECWSCDGGYDDYDYYGWYDDDDDSSDYKLEELLNDDITLKHWKNMKGHSLDYGEMNCYGNEIFQTVPNDSLNPYDDEYEGWKGNYGNTVDRWYHRGAVVLWPKARHHKGIAGADLTFFTSLMEEALESGDKSALANTIKGWVEKNVTPPSDADLLIEMLKNSKRIKDKNLSEEFLSLFDIRALNASSISSFLSLARIYGNNWCSRLLKKWHSNTNSGNLLKHKNYLPIFIKKSLKLDKSFWVKPLRKILKSNADVYIKASLQDRESSLAHLKRSEKDRVLNGWFFLEQSIILEDKTTSGKVIKFFCSNEDLFSPEGLMMILDNLQAYGQPCSTEINRITLHLEKILGRLVAKGPRDSNDWSIDIEMPCHDADCKKVASFLKSKKETIFPFPLKKERRRRIHNKIESLGIPVSHETLREGSPYTLMLKKLPEMFQKENEIYINRKRLLARIRSQKIAKQGGKIRPTPFFNPSQSGEI